MGKDGRDSKAMTTARLVDRLVVLRGNFEIGHGLFVLVQETIVSVATTAEEHEVGVQGVLHGCVQCERGIVDVGCELFRGNTFRFEDRPESFAN